MDSKVAELERKIDALTASLRATKRARELELEDDEEDEDDDGDMDVDVDMYVDVDEHTPESEPPTGRGTEELSPRFGMGGLPRKRDHANISASEHMDEDDSTVLDGSPHSTSEQRSRRLDGESVKRASGPNRRTGTSAQGGDVIDQGLLDMGTARALWKHYNDNIVRIFPAVSFKPKDTMDSIRKKKPTLFLAIMAAASGITHPELYNALHQEITRMFAEKIMMNGEKSLELVQALTLMSLWYRPPGRFEELKFYMLIHMSVAMALVRFCFWHDEICVLLTEGLGYRTWKKTPGLTSTGTSADGQRQPSNRRWLSDL